MPFSLGLIVLGFTSTAIVLLVAAGFIGLGYGTLLPGFQTLSIQSTSPERSGYAISTFFVFYDSGIALGSYIWGFIISGVGFGNMYVLSACLVLITSLILYFYLEKKEKATIELPTNSRVAQSHHID